MTAVLRHEADAPTQGHMFEVSPHSPHVEIPVDPASQLAVPAGVEHADSVMPEIVPVVGLVDRARDLKLVTDKLAKLNKIRGLGEAVETRRAEKIHSQYDGDAHEILYQAEAQTKRRTKEAKEAFARATGMYAMIESGLMTEEEAKLSTQRDWMDFLAQYADANQPNRLALRRQQDKLVKALTKPTR